MQKLFCLYLFLLPLALDASFIEVEVDGMRYFCEERGGDSSSVASCLDLAYSGPFTRSESEKLCLGANTHWPAECGVRAYGGIFTRSESLQLCIRARSLGPVECAELAYAGPYTRKETLELCAHPQATKKNAQCALELYNGIYSRKDSILYCKVGYGVAVFDDRHLANKSTLSRLTKAANWKAFYRNEYPMDEK
ncbi:hypothetical protein [Kistimonas scapharcae]